MSFLFCTGISVGLHFAKGSTNSDRLIVFYNLFNPHREIILDGVASASTGRMSMRITAGWQSGNNFTM